MAINYFNPQTKTNLTSDGWMSLSRSNPKAMYDYKPYNTDSQSSVATQAPQSGLGSISSWFGDKFNSTKDFFSPKNVNTQYSSTVGNIDPNSTSFNFSAGDVGNALKFKNGTVFTDPTSGGAYKVVDGVKSDFNVDTDMAGLGGPSTDNTTFGLSNNTWATGAQVVGAVAGLANAYNGMQQLDMAKKQFNFQKDLANRNIQNQGLAYNTELMKANKIGSALAGDSLNDAQRQQRIADTEKNYMNTSRIG